jgi:two-component system LytT family response regulator
MISVVVVVDDPIFRDMLLDMLPKAVIPTKVLATCPTLRQAKDAIDQHKPQLVFLDVELPDGKGVELFQHYEDIGTFETVFVTSHDKYAIDAIKRNVADYILKPVKLPELSIALQKVQARLEMYSKLLAVAELTSYVEKLKQQNLQENKIMINTNEGAVFIKSCDIIKLESESNYTIIFLENNKKIIASKTLSVFEEILEPLNFMRIHRSFVVNLTKVKNIESDNGNYSVKLTDGTLVEISRRKKKDFFDKISYQTI